MHWRFSIIGRHVPGMPPKVYPSAGNTKNWYKEFEATFLTGMFHVVQSAVYVAK